MLHELSQRFTRRALWGLKQPPHDSHRARRVEQLWRWPVSLVLACTVPAFYLELLEANAPPLARWAYALAALVTAAALLHTAWHGGSRGQHLRDNAFDLLLVIGLVAAAALPSSSSSTVALGLRLLVAFMTLVRMIWAMQHLITRGGLAYLLWTAGVVLLLCGAGFWWLEPRAPTLGDGLWLAFTTAATVGYGDIVPSTAASKIFSVFVVMLGYGVLSLVTAAIATRWVETEERHIEREILRDLHRQIDLLREDIRSLRASGPQVPGPPAATEDPSTSERQPM